MDKILKDLNSWLSAYDKFYCIFRMWCIFYRLLVSDVQLTRDMAGGDSTARKVLPMELSATPPQPISTYNSSSQPTGLPHVTPGLTGRHVLNVDNFNREQVELLSNSF